MSIILDRQLREYIPHNAIEFPITYFHDELVDLPDRKGPLHWHPELEIATAERAALEYQVGEQHILLEPGDGIFINENMLHGIKQLSDDLPEPMPNIVFSGTLVACETSILYQKYIQPIVECGSLPFIVFRHEDDLHRGIICLMKEIYEQMEEKGTGYELRVQRNLNRIFESISCNFESFPKMQATRIQKNNQIRLQKMLIYIYKNYAGSVTLEDIAKAANISRSEAGRCFRTYMGCSPIDALIQYRLQTARRLLNRTTLSLQEICFACGFNSVNYFSRQFKKTYGHPPSRDGNLGK